MRRSARVAQALAVQRVGLRARGNVHALVTDVEHAVAAVLPVLEAPLDVGIRARPAAYEATFDRLRLEIVSTLCPSSRASSSC